eukprot:scaffold72338_cov51-Phaeocystis_antarctica.AAC.2
MLSNLGQEKWRGVRAGGAGVTPKPTGQGPQRGEKPLAPGGAIHLMSNSVLVYIYCGMRCVCVRVPRATSLSSSAK